MSVRFGGNILVTGSNRGIGLELVKQLVAATGEHGHIFACCREPDGPSATVRQTERETFIHTQLNRLPMQNIQTYRYQHTRSNTPLFHILALKPVFLLDLNPFSTHWN